MWRRWRRWRRRREEEAGRRRRRDTESKTRTPHKDVGNFAELGESRRI